jgi:arsenate reductase
LPPAIANIDPFTYTYPMKTLLIHNPRCSKSREAKEILEALGIEFEVIDYLKDGLKEKLLKNLPLLTGLSFKEMVREKEDIFKELKLKNKNLTNNEWIILLQKHPILLERPIFIHNGKGIIARPVERITYLME